MRYPDSVSFPSLPANVFSKTDAEFALQSTETILDGVDDYIN